MTSADLQKALQSIRATNYTECMKDLGLLVVDLVDDVMLAHKAMWAEHERQRKK